MVDPGGVEDETIKLEHLPSSGESVNVAGASSGLTPPVAALLSATRDVVLFCRDSGGAPIGYPMRTLATHHDAVVFTTYAKSAKIRHLRRDPKACVLVTSSTSEGIVWASISGLARVVHPEPAELDELFDDSSNDERVPMWMAGSVRQRLAEGKRVLLEITSLRCGGIEAARWT